MRNVYSGLGGLQRYYFFMPLRLYNNYIAKVLDIVSVIIQKILKVNRLKNVNHKICKSQQWFSITKECAEYVVLQRAFIENL